MPKMKCLCFSVDCHARYASSMLVPENMSIEEAIAYAKAHLDNAPILGDLEYISDCDTIVPQNCRFSKEPAVNVPVYEIIFTSEPPCRIRFKTEKPLSELQKKKIQAIAAAAFKQTWPKESVKDLSGLQNEIFYSVLTRIMIETNLHIAYVLSYIPSDHIIMVDPDKNS